MLVHTTIFHLIVVLYFIINTFRFLLIVGLFLVLVTMNNAVIDILLFLF